MIKDANILSRFEKDPTGTSGVRLLLQFHKYRKILLTLENPLVLNV